ncbi:Callose synthase 7 [Acorus calamus]|uniref:Callose synthase 7 n=1 Tax=Acorus calamus TaxID=4465 RepID=A0AAV9FHE8_ACOCL|nr:Callose synthase 7 [Acorus calamus]
MASSSGTKSGPEGGGAPPKKSLSRRMTRMPTMVDGPEDEPTADSERVPASLGSIAPTLRVANEIEHLNGRVAYLCRFHAFEKAHNLDSTSSGRGVRQFKTYLLHRLEKEDEGTKRKLAASDPKEIQKFYLWYYDEFIKGGQVKGKPEEMSKHYQIASVLYDVLRTVVPAEKIDDEIYRHAKDVERKKANYVPFNILPLYASDAASAIMEIPDVKAAINAIRQVNNLPQLRNHSTDQTQHGNVGFLKPVDRDKSTHDLLDWLWLVFGFQKGNVENQREHLVLLLANVSTRNRPTEDHVLESKTVSNVKDKLFKNYRSWCAYLRCPSNLKDISGVERQQLDLLYIGLYLLIWGEASNVRFMPECLCYIFHNMAEELHRFFDQNVSPVTGGYSEIRGEEYFLREVITPIYKVLRKEVQKNKGGTASHSKWRNYDDLNEYFWSKKCFKKLGWPMKKDADFFLENTNLKPEVAKSEMHPRRANEEGLDSICLKI